LVPQSVDPPDPIKTLKQMTEASRDPQPYWTAREIWETGSRQLTLRETEKLLDHQAQDPESSVSMQMVRRPVVDQSGAVRNRSFQGYRFVPPDPSLRWNGMIEQALFDSPDFQRNGHRHILAYVLGSPLQGAPEAGPPLLASLVGDLVETYKVLIQEARAWTSGELLAELHTRHPDHVIKTEAQLERGLRWMQRQWFPVLKMEGRWSA